MSDTIFALASGAGMAGVAVIRVSGDCAGDALVAFGCAPVEPRRASLRKLMVGGDLLDEALVLEFEPSASFTGEAIVEFQTHGSPAVVSMALDHLGKLPGFRLAEPGEFTRRAFENGNMDLVQVDGLARLLEAETEAQQKQAITVYSGSLSDQLLVIRRLMLRTAALCEAVIDFADEEVPADVSAEVSDLLEQASSELKDILSGVHQARRLQNGYEVAIVGAPNSGKSSLINALTKRDVAIVSDVAGTTRDILEARLNLDGLLVSFLDTAGLRETEDCLEMVGIARAKQRASRADLRVFLHVGDRNLFEDLYSEGDIVIETMGDISGSSEAISSVTGEGLDGLLDDIKKELKRQASGAGIMSSVRQEEGLKGAVHGILGAKYMLKHGYAEELVAEEIRTAVRRIESLLGRIDVEDILGEVFASFCIGK